MNGPLPLPGGEVTKFNLILKRPENGGGADE